MFTSQTVCSIENNPIDIMRKYAPYLIAAGAGVGILASLYYFTFTHADHLVETTGNASADSMDHAYKLSSEAIAQAYIDTTT